MIVLKTANNDLFWFDAVVSYSEELSRTVTAFPVQSGGVITDHISESNRRFSLSGLLTDSSFFGAYQIRQDGEFVQQEVQPVVINHNKPSRFSKLIPEGLANILPVESPEVELSPAEETSAARVELLRNIWSSGEVISLLVLDEALYKVTSIISDLVITNISLPESPDDGDAVNVGMQLERVRFVTISTANAPVVNDLKLTQQSSGAGAKGAGGGNPLTDALKSLREDVPQDETIAYYTTRPLRN